jgi:uncharacterized protein
MIQAFADWFTRDILSIPTATHLYGAVNFFIYDSLKIFLLLAVIIFTISTIRTFLPQEKIKRLLSGKKGYWGNVLASVFGIFTPFCTCSAITLFIGFLEAGVPLGVTFSFLVASPMINEVALVLLLGLFGWKIAAIYVASGLVIAILSGIIIGKMKMENLVEEYILNGKLAEGAEKSLAWKERFHYAAGYVKKIIKKVWFYILIGIGIGAWIHGYVPADFLAKYASADKWYAVPLVVLIGIPLYSNAAGVIPLVGVLTEKGVAMGTSLAFMMSVTALSFPEFLILKKVMKVKLIAIFASIVGVGIIITGYLFNLILG